MKRAATILIAGLTALGIPAGVHADGPTYNHTADCAGITIVTTGWPDGSYGILGIGGNPPSAIPLNGSATWATSGSYTFTVFLQAPDQVASSEIESVDCDTPVATDPPAPPPVAAVKKSQPRVKVDTYAQWADVALAPPW